MAWSPAIASACAARCAPTTPADSTSSGPSGNGSPGPRERPQRGHVRDLFLRLLGLIFVAAFASLFVQIHVLVGSGGLLPARDFLATVPRFSAAPSVFWIDASDTALTSAAVAGMLLGGALSLHLAPRLCLVGLWALYLSFVSVGQDFLSFQWDNLLLETAPLAFLIAPSGLRPRRAPPPHAVAVFLVLWLVFRLHFESGATKLLLGDPTWRDLTAMATYYETAPLPTWVGWWAHQLPLQVHRATSLFTYVVELGLPLLLWTPARVRLAVFLFMLGMQVSIVLTANYGYFNYLTMALLLFVLDDRQLDWVAVRLRRPLAPLPSRPASAPRTAALAAVAVLLVGLSAVQFVPFVRPARGLMPVLGPLQRVLNTVRSVNAYHLFAQMTLVRREAVIEGSADGVRWLPYEFRYKPGEPLRAPAFVAPHQPRLDFQMWFLLLGGRGAPWFDALLARLLEDPGAMAPLFAGNPFPDDPPRLVRAAVYRYRMSDVATRYSTGAWWARELEGYTQPVE
jgi:lipase maturation factor 1